VLDQSSALCGEESLLVLRGAATASEGPVRAVAVRLKLLDRPFHSCRL